MRYKTRCSSKSCHLAKSLSVYLFYSLSAFLGWINWFVHSCSFKPILIRNDSKFSDRYAWANSEDPDQTRVYTVCHSVCIVWTHYSMVEPHSSNFRVITINVLGVRIFRKFTIIYCTYSEQCTKCLSLFYYR